jgi:hypothetical protein
MVACLPLGLLVAQIYVGSSIPLERLRDHFAKQLSLACVGTHMRVPIVSGSSMLPPTTPPA